MVHHYMASNFASQRVKDGMVVSLCLLEHCMMITEKMIHMYPTRKLRWRSYSQRHVGNSS